MYLDSCVIVKLLVREADSEWFDRQLRGETFETSELALTEVRSALLAKERAGHISSDELLSAGGKLLGMVEDDIHRLLPLNRRVLEHASAMQLACHPRVPLRTLDALHVATCDLHQVDAMATTDVRTRAACGQFAIALCPAQSDDARAD
jgi:predicted nucleic acid-binding protein